LFARLLFGKRADDAPQPMTPIVLHHGLFGYGHLRVGPVELSYFNGIERTVAGAGRRPVIVTHVHPTASIERRAAQLKRSILGQLHEAGCADERVVILAHSMGGLDARYMVSRLGMEDRVAAVVTVSTPHGGSPYADWCLRNLTRTGVMRVFEHVGLDVGAVKDLTCEAAARFAEEVPDVPGVGYYSVSAARDWKRITPLLLPSWRVIYKAEGENDGLVSVRSATYRRHLGTWEADHWHVINRRFTLEWHRADIRPRYLAVLDELRRDGVMAGE
jgi:triacylglycerol lipase